MRELIIGIDGGGTKTNLTAIDIKNGYIVSTSNTGSIHTSTMGEKTALHHLELGIAGLQLGNEDRVIAIAIGDPAIDDCDNDTPDIPLAAAAATRFPACKVFVKSDVYMAMYACTGGMPGAFLISGTGSMGIALTEPYHHGGSNQYMTVGGWAMPTNDPGSGFDIAIQGIQAAFHAFDGITDYTLLCEELLSFAKADSPRELIPIFNTGSLTRGQIAQFARSVDRCAQRGDETAVAILESAGHILAQYALRMLRFLSRPRIGIYGSVLLHNQFVYSTFEKDVLSELPQTQIIRPAMAPEYGAAMFAADALNIDRRFWIWK